MDNIVPFIIVMAISLVGAALNKKKPRNQGPILGPTNHAGDDFMSWINRIANDETAGEPGYSPFKPKAESEESELMEPIEVPVQKSVPVPAKPARFDSYSGFIKPEETERMMKLEGIPSVYDRKRSIGSKSIDTDPKVEQKGKRDYHFNLRNAVVSSEILNRKYC